MQNGKHADSAISNNSNLWIVALQRGVGSKAPSCTPPHGFGDATPEFFIQSF
jgi:hypothetical protein